MTTTAELTPDVGLEPMERLSQDLRIVAARLSAKEARYMVDYYYQIQEGRKRASNQAMSMTDEPHLLVDWLKGNTQRLENSLRRTMQAYAEGHTVGQWAMSIDGIGPVISAGLIAHIDIAQAPTCGHIWNFAGQNPGREWLGTAKAKQIVAAYPTSTPVDDIVISAALSLDLKPDRLRAAATIKWVAGVSSEVPLTRASIAAALAKRPWNSKLKVLCWKAGESFVKVSGKDTTFYGKLYKERKAEQEQKNSAGEFAEQAAEKLAKFAIGKDTEAYKYYSTGFLPPAHIHARAKRVVVKLFLSHWHYVAFESAYGMAPPPPYAIGVLGHAHMIQPPNWPMA